MIKLSDYEITEERLAKVFKAVQAEYPNRKIKLFIYWDEALYEATKNFVDYPGPVIDIRLENASKEEILKFNYKRIKDIPLGLDYTLECLYDEDCENDNNVEIELHKHYNIKL